MKILTFIAVLTVGIFLPIWVHAINHTVTVKNNELLSDVNYFVRSASIILAGFFHSD